jgi:hypothetical protein
MNFPMRLEPYIPTDKFYENRAITVVCAGTNSRILVDYRFGSIFLIRRPDGDITR